MDHVDVAHGLSTAVGLAIGAIGLQRTRSCSGDDQGRKLPEKHVFFAGLPGLWGKMRWGIEIEMFLVPHLQPLAKQFLDNGVPVFLEFNGDPPK